VEEQNSNPMQKTEKLSGSLAEPSDFSVEVEELDQNERAKEPKMFQVILHNDDFTPMDFVVKLLVQYFFKSMDAAYEIMLRVHKEGRGTCGVYSREVAETKVEQVKKLAKFHDYPLQCTYEPV